MATKTKKTTRTIKSPPPAQRICNLVPSVGTDTDWHFEDAMRAGAMRASRAMPQSKDLRADWWTVGDQGLTGSCVGWATADGVMRYHMVTTGKLGKAELLSSRFVWMASKETDVITNRPESFIEEAGTMLKAAMDIVRKYGTVPEEMLPFNINTLMYKDSENTFYATAAQRRAGSYFNLGKNLAQWRTWLASTGPLLAGLSVDETWDKATSTKGNLDAYKPATARGGHAICICGFTKDRFIIRNSWGKGWGDGGFAYATDQYVTDAFFNEAYGVTI